MIGDSDEFRYTTMRNPEGEEELAGIVDAASFLPEGLPAHWSVYGEVDDVDAALSAIESLDGSVEMAARDTPYGRLAAAADPAGARFNLRRTNS